MQWKITIEGVDELGTAHRAEMEIKGSSSKCVTITITSNRQRFEKAAKFCENFHCGNIVCDTD